MSLFVLGVLFTVFLLLYLRFKEEIAALRERIQSLEKTVHRLETLTGKPSAGEPESEQVAPRADAAEPAPPIQPKPERIPVPEPPAAAPRQEEVEPPAREPSLRDSLYTVDYLAGTTPRSGEEVHPPKLEQEVAKTAAAGAALPPDVPPRGPSPAEPVPPEPKPPLEALIGGKWSLRVGLLLIAIGTALFARLISPHIGPAAKVAIAYAGAWALFGVGKAYERKLKDFVRPVMAGGLALGFFVSFASHFVPPMRFLPMPAALAWMSASVLIILLFAEGWKSQPTAGLAIFLGHASAFVGAGDADAFSLTVIVFLSATAVLLLIRHDWLPLSLFALIAAYSTHMLWVFAERIETPPERAFWINVAFLSSYYVIFLAADLLWWHRLKKRGRDAYAGTAQIIGRISGPANLVLYVSLVSFFYVVTKVHLAEIYWFFFALAVLQSGVGLIHRFLKDTEHYFYPAVGAVLVTMGFFSAFDALTLNLVLAAEAIILLVAAHRTKIWLFHLLAQLTLALNFGHYWFYARTETPTLSYFIGGLATVAVYFTKSALEEIWYGGDARIEWLGGERGPVSRFFIEKFDRLYSPIAPYFAHAHAAAGSFILVNQCARYFSTSTAIWVLSLLVLISVSAGLFRRSIPLLIGYLAIEVGFIYFVAWNYQQVSVLSPWLKISAAASSVIAVNMFIMGAPRLITDRQKLLSAIRLGWPAMWAALVMTFICLFDKEEKLIYLPWIGIIALIYVSLDRIRDASRRVSEADILGAAGFLNAATCAAVSLLIVFATWRFYRLEVGLPAWLIWWSTLSIAAAGLRRNGGFYLSGLILLLSGYVFLIDDRLAMAVMNKAVASLWIILLTLGIAWSHDFLIATAGASWTSRRKRLSEITAYIIYAIALLFLIRFVEYRVAFAWSIVIISLCSIMLYLITAPFEFRLGALTSFVLVLVAHGIGLYRLQESRGFPSAVFFPTAIFFAEAVIYERLLALSKGLHTRVSHAGTRRKKEAQAGSYADITFIARAAVVAAATAVIALAIYQSATLGPRWITAGWSLVGVVLMALGFGWKSSIYRRVALVLFALCLARVFLVDTRNLSDAYKTVAFLILGLCLLGIGWLYSRFAADIRKWL